jgi:energy-converting hydrogenase Eha subunit H
MVYHVEEISKFNEREIPEQSITSTFDDTAIFLIGVIYDTGLATFYAMHREALEIGRRGRDHMVVGFTTTCAICAYQRKT